MQFLREDCGWDGPLGAYPDHGLFAAPEWIFYELDNKEAIEYVEDWVKTYNVQASRVCACVGQVVWGGVYCVCVRACVRVCVLCVCVFDR